MNRDAPIIATLLCVLPGCAGTREAQPELAGLFPGIRAVLGQSIVEFDGFVPIDAHDPESPDIYLEVVACTIGSREHEALVATDITPSNLHAAMLAAGFEPGDLLRIELITDDSAATPASWFVNLETGARFPDGGWVFHGSSLVRWRGERFYDADGTGLVIGLASFGDPDRDTPGSGGAVIESVHAFSPDASTEEPVWIADSGRMPGVGKALVVRISRRK